MLFAPSPRHSILVHPPVQISYRHNPTRGIIFPWTRRLSVTHFGCLLISGWCDALRTAGNNDDRRNVMRALFYVLPDNYYKRWCLLRAAVVSLSSSSFAHPFTSFCLIETTVLHRVIRWASNEKLTLSLSLYIYEISFRNDFSKNRLTLHRIQKLLTTCAKISQLNIERDMIVWFITKRKIYTAYAKYGDY